MTVDQCDPMMPQRYRVQHVRNEIPDTFTLELEPEDGGISRPLLPGNSICSISSALVRYRSRLAAIRPGVSRWSIQRALWEQCQGLCEN